SSVFQVRRQQEIISTILWLPWNIMLPLWPPSLLCLLTPGRLLTHKPSVNAREKSRNTPEEGIRFRYGWL
ncbi:mCG1036953, partial [Mus musculus]